MILKVGDVCILKENSVWFNKGTVVTIHSVSPDDGTVNVSSHTDARKYWILATRLKLYKGRSYKLYPIKEERYATIGADIHF